MPEEYNQGIERLTSCVKNVEIADDTVVDKLIALGVISVLDLDDVGTEPLINELNINSETAEQLVAAAAEEAKRLAAEAKQQESEKEPAQQIESEENEKEPVDKE
jgi:N utilization substance protein A